MKIAILSTYDNIGGAAKAALRLHYGLKKQGVSSKMIVQEKVTNDPDVFGITTPKNRFWNLMAKKINSLSLKVYPNRHKTIFSPSFFGGFSYENYRNQFDIFNIHWVGGGFLSTHTIKKITEPIVLTLHDSWAFTGGCHIPHPCNKFFTKCNSCIKLNSTRPYDLSTLSWEMKYQAWQKENIVLVGSSSWMVNNARNSSIFKNHRSEIIHPGLDLNVFKPLIKRDCREFLGIDLNTTLLLFGAVNAIEDENKGFHLLVSALKQLSQNTKLNKSKIKLVVFGATAPYPDDLGIEVDYLGKIIDEETLALLYSAADVTIVPSIVESFGQTASESLACGTPVVAFRSSGLIDIVDHKINGFLAKPYDYKDLAYGIDWVIADSARLLELSDKARKKALSNFGLDQYVENYSRVYESLVK